MLSDKRGRKPVVLVGLALSLARYLGMATITSFGLMFAAAFVAGCGVGLVGPALSALYLDVCDERERGRVMGLKSSSSALGGVAGPLLVAVLAGVLSPVAVFVSAALVIAFTALTASVVLPPHETAQLGAPLRVDPRTCDRCSAGHSAWPAFRGLGSGRWMWRWELERNYQPRWFALADVV